VELGLGYAVRKIPHALVVGLLHLLFEELPAHPLLDGVHVLEIGGLQGRGLEAEGLGSGEVPGELSLDTRVSQKLLPEILWQFRVSGVELEDLLGLEAVALEDLQGQVAGLVEALRMRVDEVQDGGVDGLRFPVEALGQGHAADVHAQDGLLAHGGLEDLGEGGGKLLGVGPLKVFVTCWRASRGGIFFAMRAIT
jgi:hypothetical protein